MCGVRSGVRVSLALAPEDEIPDLTEAEIARLSSRERAAYFAYLRREVHRRDPVFWGADRLGDVYWSKQREILYSVRDNPATAVPSCHDVGKSFIAARAIAWWIDTHPPGEAFVVSTAPTDKQVGAILWRELGRAHRLGNLPGRVNLKEWYLGPELVGFGRKPSDTDPTAFQGIHAKYVLVVLDEASGIPEALFDAAATLVTNEYSRTLAIGNPDDPESYFAKVCASLNWNTVQISAYDSPNFTGEEVPQAVRDVLIHPEWVERQKVEWGERSARFISKVLGEFPKDTADTLIPSSWAEACRASELAADVEGSSELPVELGVDVGAGDDETVIRERRGRKAGRRWASRHADAMRAVGEVVTAAKETGATSIKVDVIGVGFGVYGRLKELADQGVLQCEVHAVNVADRATQPTRFVNLKAEIWWEVGRELSRVHGWDLSDIDDNTLRELTMHRLRYDSSGRIQVESKDDVRARLKRSPNDADALLLAFYQPASKTPVFLGAA